MDAEAHGGKRGDSRLSISSQNVVQIFKEVNSGTATRDFENRIAFVHQCQYSVFTIMKKIQQISAGILLIAASAMGQGTVLVSDINQQALPPPANPASMVKVNPGSGEMLVISVEDALGGSEIWKSDGTPAAAPPW